MSRFSLENLLRKPDSANTTAPRELTIGTQKISVANLLRATGLLWIIIVSWVIDGLVGASIGLAIAAIALIARPVIVAAIAHAGLLILFPEVTTLSSLIAFALFEFGVSIVLFSEPPVSFSLVLLTAVFGTGFVLSTVAVHLLTAPLEAAAFLTALVATVAYGIHRYESVSLGLVTTDTS